MGVAAYNRTSNVIRQRIAADVRPAEFEFMEHLNDLPKYPEAAAPFGPVILVQGHGGWWIECQKTGYGYWYKTIREAVSRWRVTVVGYEGGCWYAEPSL